MAEPDRLRAALEKAVRMLIGERDCAYDSYTNSEGEYDDEDCEREVAELDAVIDECQAALATPASSGN